MKRPSDREIRKAFAMLEAEPDEIKSAADVNSRAKALLKSAHPDMGGSTREAQAINHGRDVLLYWLEAGRPDVFAGMRKDSGAWEAGRRRAAEDDDQEARRARAREKWEEELRREVEEETWRRRWKWGGGGAALLILFLLLRGTFTGHGDREIAAPPEIKAQPWPLLRSEVKPFSLGALGMTEEGVGSGARLGEHLTWAKGKELLECVYEGDAEEKRVHFWAQEGSAPYDVAWRRMIAGHPLGRVKRSAEKCPPDYAQAMAPPPYGLALEIELWQAPRGEWQGQNFVSVEQPPELHCLYWRADGVNWLIFENREIQRRCPDRYDGPHVKGVLVRTSRFKSWR